MQVMWLSTKQNLTLTHSCKKTLLVRYMDFGLKICPNLIFGEFCNNMNYTSKPMTCFYLSIFLSIFEFNYSVSRRTVNSSIFQPRRLNFLSVIKLAPLIFSPHNWGQNEYNGITSAGFHKSHLPPWIRMIFWCNTWTEV